ncbi:MAG: hypothetical protein NXI31_06790 [bacterium]|nr:hypothetical protein [bacterium]
MKLRLALPGLVLLSFTTPLVAQTPMEIEMMRAAAAAGMPPGAVIQSGDGPASAASGGDSEADKAAKAMLAKWKKLVFDRRPSSVLAAWAAPELKPYDPAEEKKKIDDDLREMVLEQFGVDPTKVEAPKAETKKPTDTAAKAAAQQLEAKTLQRELEMFQRDVTLSRWDKVAEFFGALPEKEQKGAYEHFLKQLLKHPRTAADRRVPSNLQEKNRFSFGETLILAGMAPGGFDKKQVKLLAPLVRRALDDGNVVEELIRLLGEEIVLPEEEQRLDRREAAMLLSALKQERELGAFLPSPEEAEEKNDREALNLLARHNLAMFAKEKRNQFLEAAWRVTQAVLKKGEVEKEEKEEALLRAVDLAPRVSEELGPKWLAQSFTEQPVRGMEIIATIGGEAAKGFQKHAKNIDYRSKVLKLQKVAVDALLESAPQLAEEWRPTLALLAAGWIVEASYTNQYSKTSRYGPMMQRDSFGNIFWSSQRMGGGGQVSAVEPADMIEAQPGGAWVTMLNDELRPHFQAVSAQLFLKVQEDEKAFPFIEQLAEVNPRKAKDLADEFLRVWMRNNNPNVNNNRTNPYMFIYGFDRRAGGIPLTRSKQERNLEALSRWVARLRKLPIGGVDQKLLSQAFVAAHSTAEVYQLETIENVFGDVGDLEPVLLGELLSKMRANLATVWRRPDVQEEKKTRRREKEMMAEVMKGYATALNVARDVMTRQGDHWALLSLTGAILHDQNNFAKEQKRDSNFSEARKGAFALFQSAAEDYVERAPDLRLDEETISAFDTWFYAALGACDLGVVDEETVVAKSQLPLIKQALASLPKGSRERHESMFANALFTRMSSVRPQIKFRYLEAGFEIVGDHPQAAEARKVWDYYADLTHELRLEVVVDGPTEVATGEFGVRVDIVHTDAIERESGGFAKYAQNQNNMSYAYNYGRPLENYRDRFDEAVRTALSEHFEVLSVTWNGEQMESESTDQVGWRRTPYAYLLLQARGEEVDRIPAIQMDFDFLDTSGYAILPIGSAPVAIDASTAATTPRPYQNLKVTQLLDERRVDEGKLTLEIKAKAEGLVPDLDDFLAMELPGYRIDKSDDQGATISKFADDQLFVETERVWLLSLVPEEGDDFGEEFVFARPTAEDVEAVYQRYADADLQTVDPRIALAQPGPEDVPVWFWVLIAVALVLFSIWFFAVQPGGGGATTADGGVQLPGTISAFSVLGLLRQLETGAPLTAPEREELTATITRIEAVHFARSQDPDLDLEAVARDWLGRANRRA